MMTLSSIERVKAAIHDLQKGKMLILIDSPERENEGDLIFPAENTTPEMINFMIQHCSGIICLPLLPSQLKKLQIPFMVPPHENTSQRGTPFTISIEAKHGVTTGVSAADRAHTILTAIKDNVSSDDIVKPGHIFPLQVREEGVLTRPGHTEGAVDIVRLAGFKPAAVLCEVMNPDGTMSRGEQLKQFAKQHRISILSIDDIIFYRQFHENLIEEEVTVELPTKEYGAFQFTVVKEKITGHEHIVLTKKNQKMQSSVLVRIHSCCTTGDLFGSERCDCHAQLHYALKCISEEGGLLIYLNQEGRGIGLLNKIKAYVLQEKGLDTVEANQNLGLSADMREYYIAATILKNRNISQVRLLTHNPEKIKGLKQYGIASVEQAVMPIFSSEHNKNYLKTKKDKLNHMI